MTFMNLRDSKELRQVRDTSEGGESPTCCGLENRHEENAPAQTTVHADATPRGKSVITRLAAPRRSTILQTFFPVPVLAEPERKLTLQITPKLACEGEARESNQLDIHADRRSVERVGAHDSRGGQNFEDGVLGVFISIRKRAFSLGAGRAKLSK